MPQRESDCIDILFVDGDELAYRSLSSAVAAHGLQVQQACEGHQAIRLAARRPARLWIANLELADMSGLELLQLVRARRPNVPFFLVSDQYSPQDEVQARAAGAAGYLSKPVSPLWWDICRTTLKRLAVRAGPVRAPG